MFNKYLEVNYQSLLSFTKKYSRNYQEPDDILHFVIDYFIQNVSKRKLDGLVKVGRMNYYLRKSIYNNCTSKSAPYYQQMIKPLIKDSRLQEFNWEYYLVETNEDELNDRIRSEYTYNIIEKIINTDYFKGFFRIKSTYEYSMIVFKDVFFKEKSIAEISRETGVSHQTLGYNYRKILRLLKMILFDRNILSVVLNDDNIYNNIEKNNSKEMEYTELLEIWKSMMPTILQSKLTKAVSQKIKKLNDPSFIRDKESIVIEIIYHFKVTRNMPPTRKYAMERIALYEEYIGKPSPYRKPGCGTCMDIVTRTCHNMIQNHKNEIFKNGSGNSNADK